MANDANPYFDLSEPVPLTTVESLFALNVRRLYGAPGEPPDLSGGAGLRFSEGSVTLIQHHETSGLFRGQLKNWPLVPACYRNLPDQELTSATDLYRAIGNTKGLFPFKRFAERAALQNPSFPRDILDRLSIAQHFGIATPLLDWSRNIFPAVFFALRDMLAEESFQEDPRIFIYHVRDERLFTASIEGNDIKSFKESALVRPYYVDRRIERQQGAFSYHPHPAHRPAKVQATVYVLEPELAMTLYDLLDGLGFTGDYYFPDYAGIAATVTAHMKL